MGKNNNPSDLLKAQVEQERLFAGAAFTSPDVALAECAWVDPASFVSPEIAAFWKALVLSGNPYQSANQVGIFTQVLGWSANVPNVIVPGEYAQAFHRLRRFRLLIDKSTRVAQAALRQDDGAVAAGIEALAEDAIAYGDEEVQTAAELGAAFDEMLASGLPPALMTGIYDLDREMGGMYPSDLILLAGRPGIGKTAVALQIARNQAERYGRKALIVSLEMEARQLWARLACGPANVEWATLRSGAATDQQKALVAQESKRLQVSLSDRLVVADRSFGIHAIHQAVLRVRPDLVIVDHLGEIKWSDPNEDEIRWFGKAARYLRREVAKKTGAPVILLHQLSRKVEDRPDKRPVLSDLKWSGDLEALADVVVFLYRDDYYQNFASAGTVPLEAIIRKNRQGKANTTATLGYNLKAQEIAGWQPSSSFYRP
jgi:replicative DNA helicase